MVPLRGTGRRTKKVTVRSPLRVTAAISCLLSVLSALPWLVLRPSCASCGQLVSSCSSSLLFCFPVDLHSSIRIASKNSKTPPLPLSPARIRPHRQAALPCCGPGTKTFNQIHDPSSGKPSGRGSHQPPGGGRLGWPDARMLAGACWVGHRKRPLHQHRMKGPGMQKTRGKTLPASGTASFPLRPEPMQVRAESADT